MKTHNTIQTQRLNSSIRGKMNPIRNLTPQSLTRILDAFQGGHIGPAALAWDAIERRDDVLQGVASKRRKAVARLNWDILTVDDSADALKHKEALQYFYNNLTATHACDGNQSGGLSLLIKQMLDSVGKKYAVHEIVYQPNKALSENNLTASFRFVPLWFFENTTGKLRFLKGDNSSESIALDPGSWLVTAGEGLMESCSIAYLFKHLPLRDWLIYCERNGMPGVKGTTDAAPGSPGWESALEAVRDFGAEFHALMSEGTDIDSIDISTKGELPYPALVERMDRAMAALWRGSDLSTIAKNNGTGASVQGDEATLLEEDDAAIVSESLNSQVDRFVLNHLFGVDHGKAYIKIQPNCTVKTNQDLQLYRQLWEMGTPIPLNHIHERFGIPQPQAGEALLTQNKQD